MTDEDQASYDKLFRFLRSHGVLQFDGAGIRVTFGGPVEVFESEDKPGVAKPEQPDPRTGLTKAQAAELFHSSEG